MVKMNLHAVAICLLGGLPLLINAGDTSITNGASGLKTTVIKTTITTTATVPAPIKSTHLANTTHFIRNIWELPTDLASKRISYQAKIASLKATISKTNIPKTGLSKTILSKTLTPSSPSATNVALASPNSTITHTTPDITVVDITATSPRSPLDNNPNGTDDDSNLTPASDPAAGFIKTCSAWQVWDANNVLWANCRARGRGTLYWSRIGLDHMLGNVGGRLVYQREGYFSSSCDKCKRRAHTTSYLQCECKDNQGDYQTTSIDLNRYLGNRDGFICSEYMCGVREGPPPGSRK